MSPQEELAQYFEVCGYAPDDLISLGTRAGAEGPLFFSVVPVSEASRRIAATPRINCWFSANPIRQPADPRSRGTAADVVAVRALWADLDVKEGGLPDKKAAKGVMREVSSLLGVNPTAVVWSGHGYQPRWRLDPEGVELHTPERFAPVIERFGQLVATVASRFGGKVDPVYDLARIIRAPHTTNLKPGLEPEPTKAWLYPDAGHITFERLLEVLDEYVPASASTNRPQPAQESRHVGTERGNAYVKAAMQAIKTELEGIATWAPGYADERGRGWDKVQADAALRLASLAKAEWNGLSLEEAKNFFIVSCPKDEHWTVREVAKKWASQVKRAEPATAPADITDDPLAGGATPLRSAAAPRTGAAADVWTDGEPRSTGDARPAAVEAAQAPVNGTGLPEWRRYSWDDRGNAERIIDLFGDRLRHAPVMKRWLWYQEGAWRESETGGERAALELFDQLPRLELELYDPTKIRKGNREVSQQDEFGEFCRDQRSAARMKAAAQVLKFTGRLDVTPASFDSEPMYLNARNGVIDLRTGELLEHDPALMLRRQIPAQYDPHAKAPRWEAFLERVMPSVDMRDYLQRIIGYSITGRTSEQVVFFHVGPPASGKSVFLRVMEAVLGEFSRVVPPTTLLNKKMEQHPTDVMGMEGRRMLQVSETPEGARLDEALLKRLSGEETITARGMGENFRDFRLVGKVHLVTNHRPHLSDDPAVHRRLHLVEWKVSIPPDERDPMLAETIIAEELEGVLAWAVRGSKRWGEDRLAKPVEALQASADYIASEDEFAQFIEDELVVGAESFTESKEVYRRYRLWCDGQGMKPMSMVAFGRKLSARGIEPSRTKHARGFKVALQAPRWAQDPLG